MEIENNPINITVKTDLFEF